MAHYYSRCYPTSSNRGEATRCGHKSTGITARADSYSIGSRIDIEWNSTLQTDIVTIYRTSGSSDQRGTRLMSYAIIDGQYTILDTSHPELLI